MMMYLNVYNINEHILYLSSSRKLSFVHSFCFWHEKCITSPFGLRTNALRTMSEIKFVPHQEQHAGICKSYLWLPKRFLQTGQISRSVISIFSDSNRIRSSWTYGKSITLKDRSFSEFSIKRFPLPANVQRTADPSVSGNCVSCSDDHWNWRSGNVWFGEWVSLSATWATPVPEVFSSRYPRAEPKPFLYQAMAASAESHSRANFLEDWSAVAIAKGTPKIDHKTSVLRNSRKLGLAD